MSATRNPMHPEEEVSADGVAPLREDQAPTQEQVVQVPVPEADSSMQEEMATPEEDPFLEPPSENARPPRAGKDYNKITGKLRPPPGGSGLFHEDIFETIDARLLGF